MIPTCRAMAVSGCRRSALAALPPRFTAPGTAEATGGNSQASQRTLVTSPDGSSSVYPTSRIIGASAGQAAVIQTADNRQWIDLDILHPKLLKELRRQYDPSIKDESTGSLGKGAAKLRAFARETKRGLEIRLRRKLNADLDEVTDIQLVTDSETPTSELPTSSDEVSELPDTSTAQELDAAPPPRVAPAASLDVSPEDTVEPLPRYEARNANSRNLGQPHTDHPSGVSQQRLDGGDRFSEGLQMLIESMQRDSVAGPEETAAPSQAEENKYPPTHLRIANSTTYETETDAEPSRKRVSPPPKRKTSNRRAQNRPNKPSDATSDSEGPQSEPEQLVRRRTVPKKVPASSGAEAIWVSLIRIQSKILGSQHPLVYRAKSDLADSRVHGHTRGASDLSSLINSKRIAIDTLGTTHPWATTFIAELEMLENLLGAPSEDNAGRNGNGDSTSGTELQSKSIDSHESDIITSRGAQRVLNNGGVQPGISVANTDDLGNVPTDEDSRTLPPLVTEFDSKEKAQSREDISPEGSRNTDALWNSWQPPHRSDNEILSLPKLAFGATLGAITSGMLWVQRNYGPAQPVETGKVRVRWTCSCGAQLYDDFTELRPGAARELEAYLNRPKTQATRHGGSPSSPHSSHPSYSFAGSSPGGLGTSQPSWTSFGSLSPGGTRGEKGSRSPITYAGLSLVSPTGTFVEPPWLLTSTNEGRYTPKVSHLDMSPMKIRSDKDLALALREHYFSVNQKWWRSLRIRGLTTIEFVQFEVHQNRFADIRKSPDMPTSPNEDYSFEAVDLLPPVGSQYLLHLFKHPEDYDGELITYLRAPKKNGRLHVGVGWGIDLIEGFRADRVWLFVSGLFSLGSVVFAVVWSHENHNVQGASGVAAYIVSLGVLVIGWLQACLG